MKKEEVECEACKIPITESNVLEIPEQWEESHNFSLEDYAGMDARQATKVEALIEDLEFVRGQDLEEVTITKSVVFSQFTTMLSLLEVHAYLN